MTSSCKWMTSTKMRRDWMNPFSVAPLHLTELLSVFLYIRTINCHFFDWIIFFDFQWTHSLIITHTHNCTSTTCAFFWQQSITWQYYIFTSWVTLLEVMFSKCLCCICNLLVDLNVLKKRTTVHWILMLAGSSITFGGCTTEIVKAVTVPNKREVHITS